MGDLMTEIFMEATKDGNVRSFRTVESAKLDWEYGGSEGFWLKSLHENAGAGELTFLMKVDAGAHAESHAHEQTEQIYVIEGTFYDQTRTYQAGDFVIRERGTNHTAGSKTGAIVLLVYTP
ncbi:cupin domain-containing protein [Microvirga vignae]|uniref:cupin domain-containing protein n=1 Tax=Microvirga vignae TaxID=1225564 RepID=UPI00069B4AEB|nr:cupin domain-containing protein [Microvirga vignae]